MDAVIHEAEVLKTESLCSANLALPTVAAYATTLPLQQLK